MGIGAGQAAGPQQDPAEVAGDDHADIGEVFPLEDLQNGAAGGTAGLAVIRETGEIILPQTVGVAVMAGLPVAGAHRFDEGGGLLLGGDGGNVTDEAAFFLDEFILGRGGDGAVAGGHMGSPFRWNGGGGLFSAET